MKKFVKFVSIIVCAVAMLALTACSAYGAPKYDTSDPQYAIAPSVLEQKLSLFMENCGVDRTSYSEKETAAAEFLAGEMSSYGLEAGVTEKFEVAVTDKVTVTTQHVLARYGSGGRKNVMITTNYDNVYESPYTGKAGTKSHGALSNGTGVASILALAEYLGQNKPELDFDVTFVLFGGSTLDTKSSSKYLNTIMTEDERSNTVLMVEFQRIGVDHVYMFTDERATRRQELFDRVASENSLELYKTTAKSASMPVEAVDGVPYYTWVMSGHSRIYLNHGIPVLNLVGANYETLDLTDTESADHGNIENTERDTLENLKKLYPDYADKMATASSLVLKSMLDPEFLSAVEYDKNNFPNTSALTKSWIWYLVVLGFIVLCYAAVTLVKMRLAKKYPIVAPQPKKIKMAVFGMDYEDKDADSIYIDLRQADSPRREEIFPGIPDNDMPAPVQPQFPVPPVFDDLIENAQKSSDANKTQDPIDVSDDPFAPPADEKTQDVEDSETVAESREETEATDQTEVEITEAAEVDTTETTEVETTESSEKTVAADADKRTTAKPRKKSSSSTVGKSGASAPRKTAARKTASAPKSTNAKKRSDDETEKHNEDPNVKE